MSKLYDKHGIPFERGDVVKVFHFIGARRKRHYLYKQVTGERTFGEHPHLMFSHLNMNDDDFAVIIDGSTLDRYEIVQSIECDHEDRPRAALQTGDA